MTLQCIALRCDGNASIGLGHVARCLALAGAAERQGAHPVIVMREDDPQGLSFVRNRGVAVHGLPARCALEDEAEHYPPDAAQVVLDLCHGSVMACPESLRRLAESLKRQERAVAVMDSMAEHAFTLRCDPRPDIVVTPYLGAEAKAPPECGCWLAGSRYAVVGEGFVAGERPRPRVSGPVRLLVSAGGSDPWGCTEIILEALSRLETEFACKVVLGPLFGEERKARLRRDHAEAANIEWLDAPADLLEPMRWADLLVGAAGLIRYEAAAMRLPALLIAPAGLYRDYFRQFNEREVARILFSDDAGFRETLGLELGRLAASAEARTEISAGCSGLVDGLGAERVMAALRDTVLEKC